MGKRNLAASVRRNEGLQNPTDSISQAADSGISVHYPISPIEALPVTKVPALDTVDQYAIDKEIEDPIHRSPLVKVNYRSDVRGVIDSLIKGYARFISSFTGLENVAFVTTRHSPFVTESQESRSVICASVILSTDVQESSSSGDCVLYEADEKSYNKDEIQFYAELGFKVNPENKCHEIPHSAEGKAFTLFVEPDKGEKALQVSFTYPRSRIPEPAVSQLLKTIAFILTESSPVLSLSMPQPEPSVLNFPPLMIPPSRDAIQHGDNAGRVSNPHLLHAAFEGWARKKPHAIALDFVHSLSSKTTPAEHSTLTYAALNAAASNLAEYLKSFLSTRGLPNEYGRVIPVHMPTSPELYISYIGILKAGHAFCPIPQDAPPKRVQEIVQAIGSPIILGNKPRSLSELRSTDGTECEPTNPTWVNVAEVSRWRELQSDNSLLVPGPETYSSLINIKENQTSYLIFTSGSTGQPKGVQVSHLAATCSIESHATAIPLPGKSVGDFRWFQFASPSFDPSIMEIFVSLGTGATLCSADRSLTLSNPEETINEARATIMMATPSLASLLRPTRLKTLEYLWSMGEKLNRTVIEKFSGGVDSSPRMLVNAYGPTEGAINCTFVAPFERHTRGSIIGKPLPTCAMFVIYPNNPTPQAVPAGLVGELAIGGPQISKGYLNLPKETAKAFVHSDEFGYLYRTGDKARIVWDETGSQVIEYLGRISTDQVKVNGRRVELGEIESVLATVPGIAEVAVVVLNKDAEPVGPEQIIACLVANNTPSEMEKQRVVEQAQEAAREYLVPSMYPSSFKIFQSLPKSSSGKLDRRAILYMLREEETGGTEISPVENEHTSAKTDEWQSAPDDNTQSLQQLVIRLVAEITDESAFSIEPGTDLYSMGLDSLRAMQFLQRLRDYSVDGLSVSDVLQSQNCRGLVSLIQDHQKSQDGKLSELQHGEILMKDLESTLQSFKDKNHIKCAEKLGVPADTLLEVLPTTATQSGMLTSILRSWADSSYVTPTYIYHSVLPLGPQVNLEDIKKAWSTVIAKYDSFRTVFCLIDEEMAPFAQCILTPESVSDVVWHTYTIPDDGTSEEDALNEVLRNAEKSIYLATPPWKISLISSSKCSRLVLSMFHGIFDGGSLQLLLEDVSLAYLGKSLSERISLDYIVKHHFRGDNFSTSRFWNDYLKDYSPTVFPSLTPSRLPSTKSTGCVQTTSRISHQDLKRLSKNLGSTSLSVLQAAWGSILLNYTGTPDQDVVMGSVVSGRLDGDSETCIGPTFTITPVRVSITQIKNGDTGPVSNRSVAHHLASFNAKALKHLQPRLGSVVGGDGQPPYDTVIAYQDFGCGSSTSELWGSVYNPPMANDFAVMLEIFPERDSSLTFRASFDPRLDSKSAELMLEQLDDIVRFILEEPNGNFEDASFQTKSRLKSSFNPKPSACPEVLNGALLHSRFEEHAMNFPEDLALIFKQDLDDDANPGNVSLTYGELNSMAENLAGYLPQVCEHLVEASVPICIEKSPALYVAILGILKAGGAWCPIDTLSPPQRRHDLIARTSSGVLLISEMDGVQPEGAVPSGVKVIDVSQFTRKSSLSISSNKPLPVQPKPTPDNMAYLIWTSGTTGAPKGVPITHAAAVSSMKSLQTDIPLNADGSPVRCLQFSQPTFDVSIQDFFYTWGVGGVLISATREIMLESFPKLANSTNATHAHLTPAFAAGVPRKSCKTLKVITMIGEKLTQPVADDWGTDMRAFNTYGPAEVTVVSTIREFGNEHKAIKSANIGWPMETVSVFVMKNQRVVMKNAVGELALGGPQLSPGYLNQEDVTKAKYVWNDEASERLYFTGDLVRMLSDGSLEYMTRVDDLVKIGGIRIELSEISFALRGCHPLIENIETMVLSRPDRPTQVVVAFLCAPKAAGIGHGGPLLLFQSPALEIARAASNQARNVLPEHMMPSIYLVLRSIPKTPSAKVDRRALQAAYASVDLDTWEGELNPEDASDDLEGDLDGSIATQIIGIVAALVNIEPSIITKPNRLRSLGVDSIRATRLAFRLKEAGHSLSVMEVLSCVTVQDLIKLATSRNGADMTVSGAFDIDAFNEDWHDAVASKISDEFTTVRTTAIQESLLTETMGKYNMYWSNHFFSLDHSVDIARLRQAWFAVCQKTEALRTGFIPVAETRNIKPNDILNFSILQLIYKLPALDWEHYKCSEEDWTELLDNRIEDIMTRHQKNYFRHPPWAVTIFNKGPERIMVFTVHHSVHDEPSLQFIIDDVRSAYTYKPPLRSQLSDGLSVILANEKKYEETLKFWVSELESFTELDVPVWPDLTGKRVSPGVTPEYQLIFEEIPLTESVTKLQSVAASLGLQSIASIIRVAWAYVSLSYLGLPATVFAETLSDRVLDLNLESSIGPFISVVPIPFNPKGTTREVLLEQQRLSVESWKHRHIHARDIRKTLKRPRGEPLYPAVFNFHAPDESPDINSLPNLWRGLEDEIGLHVEHPMAMNIFQRLDGSLILEASSDSRSMSRDHLRLFVRQVDGLISSILAFPDEPLSSLVNRLPPDLRSISTQLASEEVAKSIHNAPTHWLEQYSQTHPEWTALEVASSITADGVERETMSYRVLNAEANRVAAFLSSFGHKNRVVAVCSGRTIASYPIIIGIFKSGNTYLPIDESLPADRIAFLVQDADCPIVFTESRLISSFSGAPKSCRVECLDDPELQKAIGTMSPENKDYQCHADDSAYLLFTSGSTGKPKGVMVTRGNLSSFIESFSEFTCRVAPITLKLGGTGRYLAQANRAFDPHLLEMFFPWRHGMATVTAPRPMILDDLGLTLSKWDITHASFVPSLVDQSNITPEQCPMLRFMTVGGEKISQKVLDTWASTPDVTIVNAYGPTEVTIGCTFAHVKEHTNLRNIGPPLTACVGHVLTPGTMNYTLRGQTGELCFSGDLVARGYLNRPDATGFITGPDGEKMYRTGDVGRLMADGSVEYLGRGDDQTKIRGQRLELGEVSEVLRSSSPVAIDVVTTVAKHPGLAKVQLISFVTRSVSRQHQRKDINVAFLRSDFTTLGRELQDICRKKLPAYMVPELILPITHIPIAPMSGKANMKELQALFVELPLQTVLQGNIATNLYGEPQTRPLNTEEQAVANEVCNVIPADSSNFGPMTNIFEIGLDSLSAIGLSIRLRNLGYAATVALVMSNPIIEQLARLPRSSSSPSTNSGLSNLHQKMKDLESQYHELSSPGLEVSQVSSVRPCLPLQEGLVARSMNSENDQLYVNHVTLKLDSNVNAERLKSAIQRVTNDNEIMRTLFVSLDRELAQVVFSETSYNMQWTESEYSDLEEAIQQQKSKEVQISQEIISNISKSPPVQFHLGKCSTNKQPLALFIAIHHALYDGESFSMMLEDVATCYEGKQAPQRGSPFTFLEHVYPQNAEKAKDYWIQSMSGCHPTIFRSSADKMERPMSVHRKLNHSLTELERRSGNLQTTAPVMVQAMYALLLADFVGASDVTYGIILSGRTVSVPGAESVILPCITTIPGRLNTRYLSTLTEVVEAVQKSNSETPLFDCLFSYIRSTTPSKHNLWTEVDSYMPSEYPLALEVHADNYTNEVHLNCIFSSAFGSFSIGEEFLEKLDTVLSSVMSGEVLSLEDFNLPLEEGLSLRTLPTKWDSSSWSATETRIRELLATFCAVDLSTISKGSSFFSLGVDSVTAIQFAHKLRQMGFKVSSSDVMRYSCIGALAKHIDEIFSSTKSDAVKENGKHSVSVDKYDIRLLSKEDSISSIFECTPLQSGMITQTIGSYGKVYVYPHPIRLSDSVDIHRLKLALHKVFKLNDILRTSFHITGDLGAPWIGAVHTDPPFQWRDVTLAAGAHILSEAIGLFSFNEESCFQFPPIHPVLVNQPEGKTLVIVMHHALYDGASLPFIFEDLAMIYTGQPPLKRPQFSHMVEHVLDGQEKSSEFWVNKLRGYQAAEIPALHTSESPHSVFTSEYRIDLELARILASCREMEVTVQSVALLAYAKVYACLIGSRDIVFGQVIAGRSLPIPDADRTLGPLFNTVAQRVTLNPKFLSNKALAQRLQQQTSDAQIHQHAPLRTIQNSLRQAGKLDSTRLLDSLFVFQKSAAFTDTILEKQDIWVPYETENYTADAEYKLNVEIDHAHDGIVIRATCNSNYISQQMLDKLLHDLNVTFCDIIEHPTRCSTALPERLGELPFKRRTEENSLEPDSSEPETPAHEAVIRSVLSGVTGIPLESIKPTTSIFNIGLDSLSAIRIASVCRTKGLKTSVGDILQGITLRGISKRVQPIASQRTPAEGSLINNYNRVESKVLQGLQLKKDSIETILPCLPGQFYHLVSWLKSGRKLYEPPWVFFSPERIDSEKIQKAWIEICRRHPLLRTCFVATSHSEAVQVVLKDLVVDSDTFKTIESSKLIGEVAKEQAREEALRPSSLFTPPVRLRLLKAADSDGIILFLNHALYDAWTMPMFVSELGKLYRNQPLDSNLDFPAFVNFSLLTLRELNEKAYWTSALRNVEPTFIKSTTQPTEPVPDQLFVGVWEKVKNLAQLETECRSAGLSLQTVVLLAVGRCIAQSTGVKSPVMGLYQTGRSASFNNIEKLSGPCLNVNPFVVPNATQDSHFLEQARAIQSSLAERVSYEQSSLRDVLHWVNTQTPGAPLFNTWVNLLWMQNSIPSTKDVTPKSELDGDEDGLFLPLRIGVPTDFIPTEPLPDSPPTSVSALDASFLSDQNVFIDIGPDPKTNTIGFGVRAEGGILTEEEVKQLVTDIGRAIEEIVRSL
ncbi:hypothetical protein ARAM_001029 [Aspergillus rambellii]|uniref:Nonribosomal peptide synthetase sidC n=1 Tax=Aspergillus rambellii TaxID=308745 RepID=A0A0F8V0C8_9EURO|nr:hypothetical protein ARAM_001029 [Aspergillus rambellii]